MRDNRGWERMAYPAAYLHYEKQFLEETFQKYPDIKAAFNACENVMQEDRHEVLRETMTRHPRRIWRNLGIPDAECETLADHVGQMASLSYKNPVRGHDQKYLLSMIDIWALPLTVVDEIPLEEMGREKRKTLRGLAARLVFDRCADRNMFYIWDLLADESKKSFEESKWVHDLDHIVTARQAHDYKAAYPNLKDQLNGIIHCCRQALKTKEGANLFASIVGPTSVPVPTQPRLVA